MLLRFQLPPEICCLSVEVRQEFVDHISIDPAQLLIEVVITVRVVTIIRFAPPGFVSRSRNGSIIRKRNVLWERDVD